MTDKGVNNLRYAIIKQAVEDYRSAVAYLNRMNSTEEFFKDVESILATSRRNHEKSGAKNKRKGMLTMSEAVENVRTRIIVKEQEVKVIEAFVLSEWYAFLCDIDGERMLRQLRSAYPIKK